MALRGDVEDFRRAYAESEAAMVNTDRPKQVDDTHVRELQQEVCDLKQQLKERTEQLQHAVSMGMGMDGMEWVM